MENGKSLEGDIPYKSEEREIENPPITYPRPFDLGGARQGTVIGPVKAYPLTADEYYIMADKIPKDDLTNKQTLLLSSGLSFLFSSVVYVLTNDFYQIGTDGRQEIKWLQVIFLIIFLVMTLSLLISFCVTYKNNKSEKQYIRIMKRIEVCLGIKTS